MKNQEPTIYHLYIVEMENVPEGTDASDLPRMFREPGNAVARFSTGGNFETGISALIVSGLAFRKGWSQHNSISFFTRGNQ